MTYNFSISTKGFNDIIDITDKVQSVTDKSNVKSGLCSVFVAHSTCAITTIEYEPGLVQDFKDALEKVAPMDREYEHNKRWGDGNGYAHIRASLIGPEISVPIENGRLTLGTWQQIILIDFDNKARDRNISITILDGS